MSKRKILVAATSLIILLGALLVARMLFAVMLPSAKAEADLPRIDMSKINPGDTLLHTIPSAPGPEGYFWGVFIYKKHDGTIKIWNVSVKNNAVGMPDRHWWLPIYACQDFGPTRVNGVVDEARPIKCHDPKLPSDWWDTAWHWDIDGQNLNGGSIRDMQPTRGALHENYFVVGKLADE